MNTITHLPQFALDRIQDEIDSATWEGEVTSVDNWIPMSVLVCMPLDAKDRKAA